MNYDGGGMIPGCLPVAPDLEEIVSNGVEKASGSSLLLGDSCKFLSSLRLHSLFHLNSSNSAFASCKSLVSKPSVNQP